MLDVLEEKTLRPILAANIIRLRKSHGWSQTTLAEKLKISVVHLSRIENEHASVSGELLYSFADVFGVSTDALRQISEKSAAAR